MEYNDLFARAELLMGKEAMRQFTAKKVILFGVGGVGSWCAEGLIRSGVMHLTMVDSDRVAAANSNRQLPATTKTIGELKVEVLKRRLEEINPFAAITALPQIYSEESSESFQLEQYDYIIDAIDSLAHKHHLLVAASKNRSYCFLVHGCCPQDGSTANTRGRILEGTRLQAGLRAAGTDEEKGRETREADPLCL